MAFRVASPESERGSDIDDAWDREKAKDDVRRYHALMELLTTELSYLGDLRALFSIYLRNLPTLCRNASPFSRGSSSRNNSSTHLPKTTVLSDQGLHPLTTLNGKPKPTARQLFTDREIGLITRNVEEVLHLHDNFVEELHTAMLPLGFPMESLGVPVDASAENERIRNIDAAVQAVTTKYATEASRFDAYQFFCTGHPEALQAVHRAQHHNAIEWEAYEQHCASLIIAEEATGSRPESLRSCSEGEVYQALPTTPKRRKRTTSLTSIDGKPRHSRRLAFLDYMIKPIQRICKYPLLLDQLRPGKALRAMSHPALRPHINVVVESAAQAMRHVASAVDEARHRQDIAMQSSLIISRIALAHPSTATSHMSSVYPAFQILIPSFLSSLGTCLLAGSLDVMHYQSSKPPSGTNINAKYLGAFLYLGGYLILVKVKGKVYEPRHWFSLADFTVVDLEEEDTSLPCTFSLSCKDHQFDLTAACQREKDAWLSSIHQSLLHPPTWINEPTSSVQLDGKGELIPSTLDGPFEIINALPTIQSLPELAKEDDACQDLTEAVLAAFKGEVCQNQVPKASVVPLKTEAFTSRRSSSASVKAIFTASSDSNTIVIRRSSPTARSQVDQGLQDVISEPVLAARFQASARDELFQTPKILRTPGSFARSNSALSLTGLTKNRLSRHESVRVPRRKSLVDDGIMMASKSLRGTKKRRPIKLSIKSASEAESIFQPPSDLSASPYSQCSSSLTSPTTLESPSAPQTPRSRRPSEANPVRMLKSSPVPGSPASSVASQGSTRGGHYRTLTQGILKRWTKGSHHRRTRSAPYDQNIPEASASSLVREQSPVLPEVEFGGAISLASPREVVRAPSPPAAPSKHIRLLSAGAPRTFRHSTVENTEPRVKRISIFKRLKSMDLGLTP